MQEHDLFREYLGKTCEQVRWKKARPVIRKELGDHLEDKQAALVASGSTEDAAAEEAVRDMGDALLVGSQLDRAYRPRPAWGVIVVTALLMVIGYIARNYIVRHADSFQYGFNASRSLFCMGAAVALLIVGYFLDYSVAGKHPVITGSGIIILPILPLIFNYRINLGVFGLTPDYWDGYSYGYGASFAIFIPVAFTIFLWWWPYKGYMGLTGCYLVLGAISFLWMLIPYSPALFYCGICGIMLTAEVLKGKFSIKKPFGLLILYGPIALFFAWLLSIEGVKEGIARRLTVAFNPQLDTHGAGYMGVQIRQVLANAKWFGQGGYSAEHLPHIASDFMLAYYIYRFGWISLAAVILLFGALFAFSFQQVGRQGSKLGRMAATAILSSLMLQIAVYIINNASGWLVSSTLPLISYGNLALLTNSFLIGIMLSVFRTGDIRRDGEVAPKYIPRFKITFERIP